VTSRWLDIARALVGGPKILLLDDLLDGLAPIVVENLFDRRAGEPTVIISPRRATSLATA
jgi:ABC-type branched-subunit amino acid transport system ATPase component